MRLLTMATFFKCSLLRISFFFFDSGWVAKGKMCELKGFSRLELCFNIQYRSTMMESIAFVYKEKNAVSALLVR